MFFSTAGRRLPSTATRGRRALRGLRRSLVAASSSSSSSSPSPSSVLDAFRSIVGPDSVLDGTRESPANAGYLRGARLGRGTAVAIARPARLGQVPALLRAAVDGGCVVVAQGANTGLTGGSVPRNGGGEGEGGGDGGEGEEAEERRPSVVISTRRLDAVLPVDGGERVLCLAGVGLASLQSYVRDNVPGRASHSTLGSTFLNPTTAAGVAFGSGGTQVRKGPSTTERALYLRVDDDGSGTPQVRVVNTLGIRGLDAREGEFAYGAGDDNGGLDDVIRKLDAIVDGTGGNGAGESDDRLVSNDTYGTKPSHDEDYKNELCTFDGNLTRYNADTKGLDCNRSEGKVLILATVHDTFKQPSSTKSYWVSFADMATAARFKTDVALTDPDALPESIEYMDRGCFEVIDRAGRVQANFIKWFGTDSPLVSRAWDWKLKAEAVPGMSGVPDRIQYHLNNFIPPVLPEAVMEMGRSPERHHHIAITVGNYDDDGDEANDNVESFERRLAQFCEDQRGKVDVHELVDDSERDGVNAFRYVAAAAFPTYCAGNGLAGVSVDYALPKDRSAPPELPKGGPAPAKRMRYSHFGCNVVHEDLAYEAGADVHEAKMGLKRVVDEVCGGRLPSEHGHGTEYKAPEETKKRWMRMDPFNVMNPGVGGLSTKYQYK